MHVHRVTPIKAASPYSRHAHGSRCRVVFQVARCLRTHCMADNDKLDAKRQETKESSVGLETARAGVADIVLQSSEGSEHHAQRIF